MYMEDFIMESDVIKTGNGECGYYIIPDLCGCNPGKFGGYEFCNKDNCPINTEQFRREGKNMNTTTKINENWNSYDKLNAKCQIETYGKIYLDEYGCPIDDEYELEELTREG